MCQLPTVLLALTVSTVLAFFLLVWILVVCHYTQSRCVGGQHSDRQYLTIGACQTRKGPLVRHGDHKERVALGQKKVAISILEALAVLVALKACLSRLHG